MSEEYFLGIDTSCYTTSIAIVDKLQNLILDKRKTLEVKLGNRGLRQSEAMFQHNKNLPELFSYLNSNNIDVRKISKVCVSSKPRKIEDSYMPVFLSGTSYGKTISSILNIDYEEYSHQEGHIEAAKWSSKTIDEESFLVVHISGGTTDILMIKKNTTGYYIKKVGGTRDISAGQLIDRTGVLMGLKFPAGRELELLAQGKHSGDLNFPISVKECSINFSGIETYVKRLIQSNEKRNSEIAAALFASIGEALYRSILSACSKNNLDQVLLVGGVASNSFIRNKLDKKLKQKAIRLHMGHPKYCTDNAVGTALLGCY